MNEVCLLATKIEDIDMRLLTKEEACRELGMSLSTLDRRITAGRLTVRREPHGDRHRIYVVVDDDALQTNGATNASVTVGSGSTQLAVARERIRGLEEQVGNLREQLQWERERNVELFNELKLGRTNLSEKENVGSRWKFWRRR